MVAFAAAAFAGSADAAGARCFCSRLRHALTASTPRSASEQMRRGFMMREGCLARGQGQGSCPASKQPYKVPMSPSALLMKVLLTE